jgi:XTP/dITP diphosphohydrolase
MEILLATNNKGKVREFEELLADLPLRLRGLDEFPEIAEVEETGATFAENAILKAREYAIGSGLWAIADDSGLEVEALGNAPGIYSARYAGENASAAERNSKLLAELAKTSDSERKARFVCVIAISDEKGVIKYTAEGICEGSIAFEPSGENGFGYDPLFIPNSQNDTFAAISGAIKAKISHRAIAAQKIRGFWLA